MGNIFVALILVCFIWIGQQDESLEDSYQLKGRKEDYYNLLVAGFLDGSTAMKASVDPGLLSPDAEVRNKANYLLDANLYQGKYYLYYGVTPAVTLFTPYRLLTGYYLPTEIAILFSVAIGFLAATAVWREALSRYFTKISKWGESAAIILIGFSTATLFLLTRGAFYEIPIAGGYACSMLASLALWRSLHAKFKQKNFWLSIASLTLGLAVCCRPNYVFTLPVLLVIAFLKFRTRESYCSRGLTTLLAAAAGPAALIGLGQACYNYARFKDPIEFGFNYGLNSFFTSGNPLMSLRFFLPNLYWTYLSPPELSPYFPFVFPVAIKFLPSGYHGNEFYHGQFPTLLVSAWILIGSVCCNLLIRNNLKLFLKFLFCISAVLLGFIMLLGIRGNRYVVDFQAAFILMIAITGAIIWQQFTIHRRWSKIWRVGYIILVIISTGFNFLGAIQQFDQFGNRRSETYKNLQLIANNISSLIFTNIGRPPGPVKFTVVFANQEKAVIEPLLVAGLSEYIDSLYVVQYPDKRIELGLDHHAHGGPRSESIPIEPGRSYEIEVDLGAFYPPRVHPYFLKYDNISTDLVKNVARIKIDGRIVIDERMRSYDAPPWSLQFGLDRTRIKSKAFSGKISQIIYIKNKHQHNFTPDKLSDGIWQLSVDFSATAIGTNQPILASGLAGAGNLLFAKILSSDQIQIGLDLWGYGAPVSDIISITGTTPHKFEIFVGPLAFRFPWSTSEYGEYIKHLDEHRDTLTVYIDGKFAWSTQIKHHVNSYNYVSIGTNSQGFDTAQAVFSGRIANVTIPQHLKKNLLKKFLNLPIKAAQ